MEQFPTTGSGKGDKPRRVDKNKYDFNYTQIFGKQKKSKVLPNIQKGKTSKT